MQLLPNAYINAWVICQAGLPLRVRKVNLFRWGIKRSQCMEIHAYVALADEQEGVLTLVIGFVKTNA